MMRKDGALQPVSWEEAFTAATARLQDAGKVAAMTSTRQPVETLHAFKQLFAGGMATSFEEGMTTKVASQLAAAKGKAFEGSVQDIKNADGFLLFGADLTTQHETAGFYARRKMQNGSPLIMIDSAENTLQHLANCLLTPKTGKELDLITGLTAAIARLGQNKAEYSGDPIPVMNAAAASTGVSTDLMLEAGFKFASAAHPVIIYDGVKVGNLEVLNALVKLAEISGAVLVSLKGGANSLAAAQYGLGQTLCSKRSPGCLRGSRRRDSIGTIGKKPREGAVPGGSGQPCFQIDRHGRYRTACDHLARTGRSLFECRWRTAKG